MPQNHRGEADAGGRVDPAVEAPLASSVLVALSAYFVVVWGLGFVASRYALQYAAPFSYIGVRYAIGLGVAFALLGRRARWPTQRAEWLRVAFAGLLTHAAYLGGSHYAQRWGLSAGVTALVLALQPLATAVLVAALYGERLRIRQIAGVVVGLAGVVLVVLDRVDFTGFAPAALAAIVFSLACVTVGTLYQRHACAGVDLRAAVCIHFAAVAALMLPLGVAFEGFAIDWRPALAATLAYHVLLASIGAWSILHLLMRHGQATGVTSLLYLTPPVAALGEWAIFGVVPSPVMWAGMAVACVGVAMVTWRSRAAPVIEEPS